MTILTLVAVIDDDMIGFVVFSEVYLPPGIGTSHSVRKGAVRIRRIDRPVNSFGRRISLVPLSRTLTRGLVESHVS